MFTLQTSFKPLWFKGVGGGEQNPVVELTVNIKEESSEDFSPNNVQVFGLCTVPCYMFLQNYK
jgi:hypothetical protein